MRSFQNNIGVLSRPADLDGIAEKIEHLNKQVEELIRDKPDAALERCVQAIRLAERASDTKSLASANLYAGICCRSLSRFAMAFKYCNTAAYFFRKLGDAKGECKTANSLANIHYALSDYRNALESYLGCLAMLNGLDDKPFKAQVQTNIGLCYQEQGNLIEALKYYLQSMNIYKELGKEAAHALLNNIGIVYQNVGDDGTALSYFFKALKTEDSGALNKGFTLANIGISYMHLQDFDNAITYLTEALIGIRKIGNGQGEANVFSNLGLVCHKMGKLHEALTYYIKALRYYKETGDKSSISKELYNTGELYFDLCDFVSAKKNYLEGLQVAVQIHDEVYEGRNYVGLAKIYLRFGDTPLVSGFLDKAASLALRRKDYKELGVIYKMHGDNSKNSGRNEEAAMYIDRANEYEKKAIDTEEEGKLRSFNEGLNILHRKTSVASSLDYLELLGKEFTFGR
jgi:tetratricopeptide (TPR) repeat protein